MSLKDTILERIHNDHSRQVWTAIDFLDLGNRHAVDKVLQRLVLTSQIRRIQRGLYDYPELNSLTNTLSVPDYKSVIDAVARRDQIRILIDGLTAANNLGLTNAVPGQVNILTDGRVQPIQIQNLIIQFKKTAPSKLFWAGHPAMEIVQALHWLRDIIVGNDQNELKKISLQLIKVITQSEQKDVLLKDLNYGLSTLPLWMQAFLSEILSEFKNKN